jgi:hypothetical protein
MHCNKLLPPPIPHIITELRFKHTPLAELSPQCTKSAFFGPNLRSLAQEWNEGYMPALTDACQREGQCSSAKMPVGYR